MMMNKFRFLLLGALVLILAQGCGSKADKADIARIDSVYAIVEKAALKLKEINIDTVNARNERYKANSKVLSAHIHDIKNDDTWPWICAYGNVRKPFKTMTLEYFKYKAEIDTCRNQLDNMKHDLDNGAMSKQEFETNFIIEQAAADELFKKITSRVNSTLAQLKNFDTVHPMICNIIKEFQEKESKHSSKNGK